MAETQKESMRKSTWFQGKSTHMIYSFMCFTNVSPFYPRRFHLFLISWLCQGQLSVWETCFSSPWVPVTSWLQWVTWVTSAKNWKRTPVSPHLPGFCSFPRSEADLPKYSRDLSSIWLRMISMLWIFASQCLLCCSLELLSIEYFIFFDSQHQYTRQFPGLWKIHLTFSLRQWFECDSFSTWTSLLLWPSSPGDAQTLEAFWSAAPPWAAKAANRERCRCGGDELSLKPSSLGMISSLPKTI